MTAHKEKLYKLFLLISYLGMLIIQLTVTVLNNMDYYQHFPFSIPRNLLKYALLGILIYLLPYERIVNHVRQSISDSEKYPEIWQNIYPYLFLAFDCGISLLAFGLLIYIHTNHYWNYYHLLSREFLPIILAMFALIRMLQIIKNSWVSYFLCCFIWTPLTVILVHYMTKRFVFSGIIGISMLLTYWIGMRMIHHKTNWLRLILSLLAGVFALWCGMFLTNNLKNLLGMFYPERYISDSAAQARYLIWENAPFTVPEGMSSFFYIEHPLTAIHMYLGTFALILFLVFQIAFIAFLFMTWKKAIQKSQTNGLLFGGLSLLFVGTYIYVLLGDLGALPATTINYLYMSIDIPLICFMLRLTTPLPLLIRDKAKPNRIDKLLLTLYFEKEENYEDEDEDDDSSLGEMLVNIKNLSDYSSDINVKEKEIQDAFHSNNEEDENHGK